MFKKFLKDETGDTNIISIIVILAVIIALFLLFKPYVAELFSQLFN